MGLDVSHDCWTGAYSAFTRWRNALAEAAGIGLKLHPGDPIPMPAIDWEGLDSGRYGDTLIGDWIQTPDEPLLILFAHYDTDGHILARDCTPLADRLAEVLPNMPEGDGGGHIGDWREKTQKFIDGLRLAAERGEDVEFS